MNKQKATNLDFVKWRKKAIFSLFAASVLLCVSHIGFAAPGDDDEQLRRARQQEQERQQRQQSRDVFLQSKDQSSKDYKLPDESPAFLVRTIQIDGDDVRHFSWLQAEANHYANKKVGKQGVDIIVKRLSNSLIDHGYITSRLLVPEQDLTSGTLKLKLIAGRIGDIRFDASVTHADWRGAFPCTNGDLLNLRDLEQGLEQLKRVPSQDVDFKLMPGKQSGLSDILITMKRGVADKFIVSIDDSGSRATGRLQSTYTYSVDNLFGKNDLFNLSLNNDAQDDSSIKGTGGHSFYWSIPNGYYTYSFSYRTSNYKQTIPFFGGDIKFTGESETGEVKIERMLQRDKSSKTSINLKLVLNKGHNFINDVEITTQRKQTTSLELGLFHRRYVGKATWDYQVAYRHGMPWFSPQDDNDISGGIYTSQYGLWTAEIDLNAPVSLLGKEARYSMTLRGQYTNSRIYSGEWFSIGNRYTVRGFDGEQTLSGENGWYLRNELSFPISENGREIYYGLDYGRVSGPSVSNMTRRDLMGAVIGLRGSIGRTNMDIFVGWPLKQPPTMTSENPTFGFQCSWQV